jgi:hypothetical protein
VILQPLPVEDRLRLRIAGSIYAAVRQAMAPGPTRPLAIAGRQTWLCIRKRASSRLWAPQDTASCAAKNSLATGLAPRSPKCRARVGRGGMIRASSRKLWLAVAHSLTMGVGPEPAGRITLGDTGREAQQGEGRRGKELGLSQGFRSHATKRCKECAKRTFIAVASHKYEKLCVCVGAVRAGGIRRSTCTPRHCLHPVARCVS